jgi:hypothetical protein
MVVVLVVFGFRYNELFELDYAGIEHTVPFRKALIGLP